MKKKLSSFLASASVIALLATALSGCGGGSAADKAPGASGSTGSSAGGEPVTLKFWTQSDPAYGKAAKVLFDKFQKENPNITIKLETFPEYNTKIKTAFNTGNEPDVMEAYGSTSSWAKAGKILPVPDSVMTKEEIEKIYTKDSLENRLYDGKYYGLPNEIQMESPGLLVNTELVKKAGLTIPESWIKNDGPASWSELLDFAHKLTVIDSNGTMKQAGLGVINGQEESMFLSLIWQLGGDYRDPQNGKVHFTTPEATKAVEFMKSLIEGEGRVHDKGFGKRLEGFAGGTTAMTIGAPWYAASFETDVPNLKFQYFNLPPFIDGAKPYFLSEGGWGYLVSSRTKHPEEAWKLVKFLLQKENQEYWTQAVGSITSRKDLTLDTSYDPNVGSTKKALAISQKLIEYGKDAGSYTTDTSQLVWTIIRQNLRAMLQGEMTIEQGLKNIEDQGNQMIERNSKR